MFSLDQEPTKKEAPTREFNQVAGTLVQDHHGAQTGRSFTFGLIIFTSNDCLPSEDSQGLLTSNAKRYQQPASKIKSGRDVNAATWS